MKLLSLFFAAFFLSQPAFAQSHKIEILADIFAPVLTLAGSTSSVTTTVSPAVLLTPWLSLGGEIKDHWESDRRLRLIFATGRIYPFSDEQFFIIGGVGHVSREISEDGTSLKSNGAAFEVGTGWRWTFAGSGLTDLGVYYENYVLPRQDEIEPPNSKLFLATSNFDLTLKWMVGFGF